MIDIDVMEKYELKELCKKLKLENEQLKKYIDHLEFCEFLLDGFKCTCGLDKLLKEKL